MNEPTEDISSITPGEVTVKATITHKYAHRIRNGNLMTDVVVADKTGSTKAVWFSKQPKDDLAVGSEYIFSGRYQLKYGRLALQSPKYKATGEKSSTDELAKSPLILPARDYPSKKSPQRNWLGWTGAIIFYGLIITGVIYAFTNNSQSTDTTSTSSQSTSSNPSTPTDLHNGIPEIPLATQTESNSKCIDVTSIDYDWDDDVLCTRPDGSQFYTNYAGGRTADPTFER